LAKAGKPMKEAAKELAAEKQTPDTAKAVAKQAAEAPTS